MKFVRNLTLLPILVFVAFLAFSLRLVDVVSGVMTVSSALAETKEPEVPGEHVAEAKAEEAKPEEKKTEEHAAAPEAEHKDGAAPVNAASAGHAEKPAVDVPKWMDATDSDSDGMGVKMELYQDLVKRREALDKRENELMTREALLRAAETELDQKVQELTGLRKEIEGLLTKQSDEEIARTASLVKIYEGMKPAQAAKIFDTLDLDVLLSVVSQMSERKLAPVMAAMNPERARTVTIMLAEQKQLPSLPQN